MNSSLEDAEKLCTTILGILGNLPLEVYPNREVEKFKLKVINIRRDISESKKKVMMRAAKGMILSEKTRNSASKLEKMLNNLSKNQDLKSTELFTTLASYLSNFESDVSNMKIYWHSFEAVIT